MNSYQFFLKHAGYSYNPKTETLMQGRIRSARALAKAEREARDGEPWGDPYRRIVEAELAIEALQQVTS